MPISNFGTIISFFSLVILRFMETKVLTSYGFDRVPSLKLMLDRLIRKSSIMGTANTHLHIN